MGNMTPDARVRLEWAESAIYALERCRPNHATAICTAWLQAAETGGPQHDPFGLIYSDARFWAVAAPQHELVAYTLAGLERAPSALLSLLDRKKTFKALWRSFPNSERAAFLKHVNGGRE